MGNQRFANRASSVLAGAITSAGGTLTVSAGEGARFPILAAGQYFHAVIQAGDGDGDAREFVRVTARAGDVMTIERATEGSAALDWPLSSTFAHIATAAGMTSLADEDDVLVLFNQVQAIDGDLDALTTQVVAIGADLDTAEAAILTKEPIITAGTIAQYWRGDKTWRDFFTDVRAATLTGLSTATNSAVTAADTVLVGIGKLQAQANNLANNVLATVLTGLSLASTTAITATDTVLTAMGRLQAQITANLAAATAALALRVPIDSTTGAAQLPAGTTAQRPAAGAGKFRFNSDLGRFEGNNGAAWGSLGGATGGGNDAVFYVNGQTVTSNYTVPAGQNAMSAGPITIADAVLVDISTGSAWTIV